MMIMNLKIEKVLKRIRRLKMSYKRLFFVLILVTVSALEIFAGGRDRVGTAGATELLIPIGARGTALGGSYSCSASGVDALFWNPAGISGTNMGAEVMFSHMSYVADIGISAFGLTTTFADVGTLGFALRSFSFGDIPVTTETSPDISGDNFSPSYTILGVTYSRALSDKVRAGITFNFVNETIASVSANGFCFDVGVQYFGLAGLNGLKLGITAKNLGPQMKYDGGGLFKTVTVSDNDRTTTSLLKVDAAGYELPSYFELAVGYEQNFTADHKAIFSTSFQNNNYQSDEYKLAMEYAFRDLFFVRGSYQFVPQDSDEYLYGPAFGAGIHYSTGGVDMAVDYAYRANKTFDANHIITIKLGF
jgi:hypothetical protein